MTTNCTAQDTTFQHKNTKPGRQPGQCLVVQEGLIYWTIPPNSLEKATQHSFLSQDDCILLLDFLRDQPFDYWKAITLNENKIVYTTTTNLNLALVDSENDAPQPEEEEEEGITQTP